MGFITLKVYIEFINSSGQKKELYEDSFLLGCSCHKIVLFQVYKTTIFDEGNKNNEFMSWSPESRIFI
jgi:hypothetical protein